MWVRIDMENLFECPEHEKRSEDVLIIHPANLSTV